MLNSSPYIISEIGVNHENSLEKAIQMIYEIRDSGGHAAKFQAYKASSLASKFSPAYWDQDEEATTSQFELFSKYDSFGKKEYSILVNECKKAGIDFLCTPFDLELVDLVVPMCPYIKIASADLTNFPLLKKVSSYDKPIILSTGASTLSEIVKAYEFIKEQGIEKIALLHCVLSYPTQLDHAQLNTISFLKSTFPDATIGYSDHTKPGDMLIPFISYTLGATIIEKHYTYDKSLPGNDHYHSMDKDDLRKLINMIESYNTCIGKPNKVLQDCELPARENARRGLVASKDLKKGSIISTDDIAVKRPAKNLAPIDLEWLIGRTLKEKIKADHFIELKHIL